MPSKDPLLTGEIILAVGGLGIKMSDGTSVVDGSGNIVAPITDTLARGNILVGNSSGVSAAVDFNDNGKIGIGDGTDYASKAISGDATLASTGVLTVVGATGAFNVGTNQTWAKEVNHTNTVTTSTTATSAGGNLAAAAGQGATTGAGGVWSAAGGASGTGATGDGGVASITGGAALSTDGVGGVGKTVGGAGHGTQAGGKGQVTGGAGGATGAGGTADVTGGIGGATSGNGGASNVTGGAATNGNGNGGDVVIAGGAKNGTGIAGGIYLRGLPFFKLSAPAAKTTSTTLTAAELLGGLITANQGGAAAATYTLPLGTDLQAALPASLAVGDCFQFSVINISTNAAEDLTMAGNTGTTYVGATLINANDVTTETSAATFVVRTTGVGAGAGTFSIYRVS